MIRNDRIEKAVERHFRERIVPLYPIEYPIDKMTGWEKARYIDMLESFKAISSYIEALNAEKAEPPIDCDCVVPYIEKKSDVYCGKCGGQLPNHPKHMNNYGKEKAERCPVTKDFIQEHYDEFLGYYYNSPCSGCKGGHSSFWKTIVESEEWKLWKATNPMYDFAECEELGIMGKEHFKAFIDFIRTGKLSTSGVTEDELIEILRNELPANYDGTADEKILYPILYNIACKISRAIDRQKER
jgi:hypothetical protein